MSSFTTPSTDQQPEKQQQEQHEPEPAGKSVNDGESEQKSSEEHGKSLKDAVYSNLVDPFKQIGLSSTASNQDRVRVVQASEASHLSSDLTFTDEALKIPNAIRKAIVLNLGFEKLSKIQALALPLVLEGKNLIAQAQSGAGKTVAFTIGMLNRIDLSLDALQAVCLTNNRELANQIVNDAIIPLSQHMPGFRVETVVKSEEKVDGKRSNAHLIVGTPGTVLTYLRLRYLDPRNVKIFVLDEADAMVAKNDLGKQTLDVKKQMPQNCQVLFFSATYTPEVLAYSKRIVTDAYTIKLANKEELVLEEIMQLWVNTSRKDGGKLKVLQDLYSYMSIQQSIVFVEQRSDADRISAQMINDGYTVSTYHSGKDEERDIIMRNFREGKSKVLICTNALARGVDVPAVAVVVNYDLPTERKGPNAPRIPDYTTYIHRIGRTGRFGRQGTAINFVDNEDDRRILNEINNFYSPGKTMITEWDVNDIAGLAACHNERAEGGGADVVDDDEPHVKGVW